MPGNNLVDFKKEFWETKPLHLKSIIKFGDEFNSPEKLITQILANRCIPSSYVNSIENGVGTPIKSMDGYFIDIDEFEKSLGE
jgi:hypothetical protein